MKTREFIISIQELDLCYNSDITLNIVEEYIHEDLEIPEECVDSFNISTEYVNVKLAKNSKYFNDDWYVNLHRVG